MIKTSILTSPSNLSDFVSRHNVNGRPEQKTALSSGDGMPAIQIQPDTGIRSNRAYSCVLSND
jgi:hypothetical protein